MPEWGAVQWPFATTTVGVATEDIFGRVYEAGLTEGVGQGASIYAELGYGDDGTDPSTDGSWSWVTATYEGDLWLPDNTNDDQYVAAIIPLTPGIYDYAYRFSRDEITWVYGDMRGLGPDTDPGGGSADGYNVANAGHLVVEPEPVVLCPKWVQPADCEFGVDLPSYAIDQEQGGPLTFYVVGDDWVCDGRPITAIRWWGSYPGWGDPVPPLVPESGRPLAFRLSWYTDIPVGHPDGGEYSRPGHMLTNAIVMLLDFDVPVQGPGLVTEALYCSVPKEVPPSIEHEYEYFVELAEPWNEKRGCVYWLTIEALYPMGYVPDSDHPEWGWKTSVEQDIIDDAVVWPAIEVPVLTWYELIWPHFPWLPGLFFPPEATLSYYGYLVQPINTGPSIDMAFELLTDVCPRRTEKWSQMPDMVYGEDLWSWTTPSGEQRSDFLRADDFISDGRLISDIHWWGSHQGWMTDVSDTGETNPVAPPVIAPEQRLLGFNLSWHTNAACISGTDLALLHVPIDDCHEMYYGTVVQDWPEQETVYEHEYQYYVDLLALDSPWQEETNGHYWLNIEAVFDDVFVPGYPDESGHFGWGWKIAEFNPDMPGGIECIPAVYDRTAGAWTSDRGSLSLNNPRLEIEPMGRYDMAFELTTHEVSTNSLTLPIAITNMIASGEVSTHVVKSLGTSGTGTQYLQMNTNLLTNVWTDVPGMVKVSPFPPPITNTWIRTGATERDVFYRVLEK